MKPRLSLFVAVGLLAASIAPVLAQPSSPTAAKRPPATPGAHDRVTASGVVLMEVDYNTGRVSNVRMLKSTGSRILDDSATNAFRKHSYKPRTFRGLVKVPITFTLTGTKR